MSEHLIRAREWLTTVGPVSTDPNDIPRLSSAMWHLIKHLEAQQETPASGLTSPESATARAASATETGASSPAPLTMASTPGTGTTEPISSLLERGSTSEVSGFHQTQRQVNRTASPTSFTPATDRSTGPSASTAECLNHDWELARVGWDSRITNKDCDPTSVSLRCPTCRKVLVFPGLPPESAAQPGREE